MEHVQDFHAAGAVPHVAAREHPQMILFNRVGGLLVASGLPPLPDVYDLLWRYCEGADYHLGAAIEAALAAGGLDLPAVADLRERFCSDIAVGEVSALVASAHAQAAQIAGRLMDGRSDLAAYGRTIAEGDAALNGRDAPTTAAALAEVIRRLNLATAEMLVANRRMEAELTFAADETGALRDKLHRVERIAVTDPLTGLLNRRGIMEVLQLLRQGSEDAKPLTVAVVDIDHFKRVNDKWGHNVGDEVLRYVATHLAEGVSGYDGGRAAVGRLGGEEFIAILPGVAPRAGLALIDRLRASLAGQLLRRNADGTSLGRVSFSAGVAADRAGDDAEALIGRADAALYTAKRLGRDRVIPDRA